MSTHSRWVFGYGSLMWNPGFEYAERRKARLSGYARKLRLWSVQYRGTPDSPGLVLGLDEEPGGHCVGVAYRVERESAKDVADYLWRREMITYAYRERLLPVELLEDGRGVKALCYVMDRYHAQYAVGLSDPDVARVVARSRGSAGENRDYLHETLRHLRELGVREEGLERLGALVEQIRGGPEEGIAEEGAARLPARLE